MKRTTYIGSRLHPGTVTVAGMTINPKLLPGMVGVMFAYESQAVCESNNESVLVTAEMDDGKPKPRRGEKGKR